jgi:hypothetical protein
MLIFNYTQTYFVQYRMRFLSCYTHYTSALSAQIDYALLRPVDVFQPISYVPAMTATSLTSGFEGRNIWIPLGHLSAP